jgi:hypothetical protein
MYINIVLDSEMIDSWSSIINTQHNLKFILFLTEESNWGFGSLFHTTQTKETRTVIIILPGTEYLYFTAVMLSADIVLCSHKWNFFNL